MGLEKIDFIGQTEEERPYQERQRQPGDYEAQVSQRAIAVHALEHHGSSDAGVIRLRHLLRKQVRGLSEDAAPGYPPAGPDGIATYIQDSVAPWPENVNGLDERQLMRHSGDRVAQAIIESAALPTGQRRQLVREAFGTAGAT